MRPRFSSGGLCNQHPLLNSMTSGVGVHTGAAANMEISNPSTCFSLCTCTLRYFVQCQMHPLERAWPHSFCTCATAAFALLHVHLLLHGAIQRLCSGRLSGFVNTQLRICFALGITGFCAQYRARIVSDRHIPNNDISMQSGIRQPAKITFDVM